ncbi:MAG TPA: DUF6457 domain-containing protein [Streptosporangiaceae bacterium]|nr:DUF6457 domain-containing protein [Streptosporangiaceae bacterium]
MNTLEEWVRLVCAELGLDEALTESLMGDTRGVLDLARDVAHGVERPAAPLTAYLLGVAVGRGRGRAESAEAVRQLATAWGAEHARAEE